MSGHRGLRSVVWSWRLPSFSAPNRPNGTPGSKVFPQHPDHDQQKGPSISPTEHPPKTPSPRTGLFALLGALLRTNGTSAPKITPPVNIKTDAAVRPANEKKQKMTASFVSLPLNTTIMGTLAVIFCFFSLAGFATLGPSPALASSRVFLREIKETTPGSRVGPGRDRGAAKSAHEEQVNDLWVESGENGKEALADVRAPAIHRAKTSSSKRCPSRRRHRRSKAPTDSNTSRSKTQANTSTSWVGLVKKRRRAASSCTTTKAKNP